MVSTHTQYRQDLYYTIDYGIIYKPCIYGTYNINLAQGGGTPIDCTLSCDRGQNKSQQSSQLYLLTYVGGQYMVKRVSSDKTPNHV